MQNGIAVSLKNMVAILFVFLFAQVNIAWADGPTSVEPSKASAPASLSIIGVGKSFKAESPVGEDGVVYWDSEGNTYERHTLGYRECKFYANGQLVARYFVGDLSKPHNFQETYGQCVLIGKTVAAGMKMTTAIVKK